MEARHEQVLSEVEVLTRHDCLMDFPVLNHEKALTHLEDEVVFAGLDERDAVVFDKD